MNNLALSHEAHLISKIQKLGDLLPYTASYRRDLVNTSYKKQGQTHLFAYLLRSDIRSTGGFGEGGQHLLILLASMSARTLETHTCEGLEGVSVQLGS